MASAYSTFTDMKVGEVLYEGERFLTQYEVRKVRMESVVNKKASQEIHVEITLGRQLLGVILNVIIPTFVLNIISYSTNFYKESYFETVKPSDSFQLNLDPTLQVIAINLTTMLVMVTLFVSVSRLLQTSPLLISSSSSRSMRVCLPPLT